MIRIMRITVTSGFVRFLWYVTIFILPTGIVVGAWVYAPKLFPGISPLLIIIGSNILIGFLLVFLSIRRPHKEGLTIREEELMASQKQLQSLYENSPVPYVTIDPDGYITAYNLAAVRFLQTQTDALIGEKLEPFLTHEDTNVLSVVLGRLMSGYPIADQEIEVVTTQKEQRYALLSVFTDNVTNRRLVSLVDITHQKTIDRAKSEFVALATHQLRTPVAAIRWNLELLERSVEKPHTEKQEQYFIKIQRNVLRMIALINDFLSVSKLETGTFSTTPEAIDVRTFFESVADEYVEALSKKKLNIQKQYEPESFQFVTDTRLLHIIVSNLLSNAVKYTPVEGSITFSYKATAETVVITVADTGIGVPEDELEKLFTKFFRARNAQVHQTEGTGLGLYIVKQSAEKLGGSIAVTSVEDRGTTFTVQLPTKH